MTVPGLDPGIVPVIHAAPPNGETSLQFQGRRLSDGAHAFAAVLGVVAP